MLFRASSFLIASACFVLAGDASAVTFSSYASMSIDYTATTAPSNSSTKFQTEDLVVTKGWRPDPIEGTNLFDEYQDTYDFPGPYNPRTFRGLDSIGRGAAVYFFTNKSSHAIDLRFDFQGFAQTKISNYDPSESPPVYPSGSVMSLALAAIYLPQRDFSIPFPTISTSAHDTAAGFHRYSIIPANIPPSQSSVTTITSNTIDETFLYTLLPSEKMTLDLRFRTHTIVTPIPVPLPGLLLVSGLSILWPLTRRKGTRSYH